MSRFVSFCLFICFSGQQKLSINFSWTRQTKLTDFCQKFPILKSLTSAAFVITADAEQSSTQIIGILFLLLHFDCSLKNHLKDNNFNTISVCFGLNSIKLGMLQSYCIINRPDVSYLFIRSVFSVVMYVCKQNFKARNTLWPEFQTLPKIMRYFFFYKISEI